MATLPFINARIFVGGFEISGDSNALGVALAAEMLDETCFGDTTRIHKGGLKTVEVTAAGNVDAAAGHVDRIAFDIVGLDDQIVTVFVNGITEGAGAAGISATDTGFSTKGVIEKYGVKGDVGSLLGFDLAIMGRGIEA